MRTFIILTLLIIFYSSGRADEVPYELKEVVVTATRIPTNLPSVLRSITIIDGEEIEGAPVHSVPELLQHAMGVDLRRRGVYGIQADTSIRGSSFEQVLILIDGARLSDPQTGHYNMDIPLTLMDIERVEVLHGHGSSLYGPNAFGGVVNIITKKPKRKEATAEFSLGEHSLSSGILSFSYPLGNSFHRLSFEGRESSGYRENTEFDTSIFSCRSAIKSDLGLIDLSLGYVDKEFGADSFYIGKDPTEWEHTETKFVSLGSQMERKDFTIKSKLYWRHHWNKYVWDKNKPWNFNRHTTQVYGEELEVHMLSSLGTFILGGEFGQEEIDSTAIGDHSRSREAIYAEFQPKLRKRLIANFGLRGDHYSGWGWEACPSLSLGYRLNPSIKLRGSLGRSFRVPTYTELYYPGPGNKGNSDLNPEKAWSYEIGMDYSKEVFQAAFTIFRREGEDLIDWVRKTKDEDWIANNWQEVNTSGFEAALRIKPKEFNSSSPISLIQLGYTYLDSDKEEDDLLSKYVLDYLRHQCSLGVNHSLPFGVSQAWRLSYEDRVGEDNYFLLDTRISKKLRGGVMEIFIEGTNLFNTSYSEISGVPMPGRWIQGGMRIQF